jgi:hypothetical protein
VLAKVGTALVANGRLSGWVNNLIQTPLGGHCIVDFGDTTFRDFFSHNLLYGCSYRLYLKDGQYLFKVATLNDLSVFTTNTANLSKKPVFAGLQLGLYMLAKDSPGVDAGYNVLQSGLKGATAYDVMRLIRPLGSAFDMGAHEYQPEPAGP